MAKSKTDPKQDDVVLPATRTVAAEVEAVEAQLKELRDGMAQTKGKVWFVLVTQVVWAKPGEFKLPRTTNVWLWAHTKSYARTLARKARDDGHVVVDIFQGTKPHISHKFTGIQEVSMQFFKSIFRRKPRERAVENREVLAQLSLMDLRMRTLERQVRRLLPPGSQTIKQTEPSDLDSYAAPWVP